MKGRLWVGVDGGGTHTAAAAAQPDGTVIALGRGAGINYNSIGLARARENLLALLSAMPEVAAQGIARMCVGLSALDGPADAQTAQAFAAGAFDPETLDLQSDAYVALMGLTQGGPGLIIICGTGSMLVAADAAGGQHVLGGWGHLLGDVGGSHALALEGLRAAIDAWEGVGPQTALADAALSHFRIEKPRMLIDRVYAPDASPSDIAQFARLVLSLAGEDAVADAIVTRQMRHVAAQAGQLLDRMPEIKQVGLYGGIFAHHPRVFALLKGLLLAQRPHLAVVFPENPPELGALMRLFQVQGVLTEDVAARLQRSYQALKIGGSVR